MTSPLLGKRQLLTYEGSVDREMKSRVEITDKK